VRVLTHHLKVALLFIALLFIALLFIALLFRAGIMINNRKGL
jgi:hypothetical protein